MLKLRSRMFRDVLKKLDGRIASYWQRSKIRERKITMVSKSKIKDHRLVKGNFHRENRDMNERPEINQTIFTTKNLDLSRAVVLG